jgi:hypothetical protein
MGRKKMTDAARIRAYFTKHPNAKPKDAAITLNVSPANVYVVRSKMKAEAKPDSTPAPKWETLAMSISSQPTTITLGAVQEPEEDMVNHPPHYKTGGIETIDFIEAKGLNYRLGNVVKYVTRADHKGDRMENLQKALWYLQREIEKG